MARHLLDLGHKKVAYIAPPLTVRQKQRSKRVEGFLKEFSEAGLANGVVIKSANESIDQDVPGIDSEYRIGYDLTKEVLAEHGDVTAIVGLNDMIAFGIWMHFMTKSTRCQMTCRLWGVTIPCFLK